MEVNGDQVEYLIEEKKVRASGNVVITYEDMKMTCDEVVVFTETKEAEGRGNVVLYQENNILKGDSVHYNFQTKKGTFFKADVTSPPFYGRGQKGRKVAEKELRVERGYITTCDLEKPHYRIQSRHIKIFFDDKVAAKHVLFFLDDIPIFYLPYYMHPLDDDRPRVTIIPGKDKDWGAYVLTAWRYYFHEGARGRIHLDYRERRDMAYGIDYYYKTDNLGEGSLRTYYMNERGKIRFDDEKRFREMERYRVQLRHKWEIDPKTTATLEYYKMSDEDFLKDYFYREEYERDMEPESYLSLVHTESDYTLSLTAKKRTNRFFGRVERLPEIELSTRNLRIGDTYFYYKNTSSLSSLTRRRANSGVDDDAVRLDTDNQLSYKTKLGFLSLTPYVGMEETYFSKDVNGDERLWRSAFYSGLDVSSRFYKTFDVEGKFLGTEIHGLRHIVFPSLKYKYIHDPTVSVSRLQQFDSIDSVDEDNSVTFSLENKLQTRQTQAEGFNTVDLGNLILEADYDYKPQDRGSGFTEVRTDLELTPCSWLRIEQDTTYGPQENYFKLINTDLVSHGEKWQLGLGHRYKWHESSQLTAEAQYTLTPKWKVRAYHRWEFDTGVLEEHEYALTRDLHCWIGELTCNYEKGGDLTIWLAFRLKAFPRIGFHFETSYHRPRSKQ